MQQNRENDLAHGCGAWLASRSAIVVTGVAVLSISAACAWLLHSGVGSATAQSGTQFAARMPEMAVTPGPTDQDRFNWEAAAFAPRLTGITIEIGQASVVEGMAPPKSAVSLIGNGQPIGQTMAKADGSWQMMIERGFARGDHRLLVRASTGNGLADRLSDTVRISTPTAISGPLVVLFPSAADGAASSRPRNPGSASTQPSEAPSMPMIRVAEISNTSGTALGDFRSVREWLQRADRSYNSVVVKKLSTTSDSAVVINTGGSAAAVVAQAQPVPTPNPPKIGPGDPAANSVIDGLLNWLKRSSDTYQKAIVKRLAEPGPTLESLEARNKIDEAKKAADARVGEDAQQMARDELRAAQAKRDADLKAAEATRKTTEAVSPKSAAVQPAAEEEAAKKVADDKRVADEAAKRTADLKAAEERRAADLKAADDKRVADEAAKRAADLKAAEVRKAADDAAARELAARKADDKRVADETAKRTADLKAAEVKKAADDATARDLVARKAAEEKRVADEAAKRAADQKSAEAQKASEDIRRVQEAAQRAAAEARRAEELSRDAEARRQAEMKSVEAARQAAAAANARAAEAQRAAAAKAAEDVRRRGAELAEAASKEATSRLVTQPPATPKAPEPKQPSVAVAPSKPTVTPPADRVARAAPPPARRRPPIDTSSRSALGAGAASHAIARKSDDSSEDRCRKAGKRIKPPGYYVVKSGDSLWDIADLHYGDGARFAVIERANRRIGDPDMIKPCQRVFVPVPKRG